MKLLTNLIDNNKANTTKIKGKNPPHQFYWQTLPPIEALIFFA